MPIEYRLVLTVEQLEEQIVLSGEFSDNAGITFEAFVQYAEDLFNTKLIQNQNWGSLNIKWNEISNLMTTETDLPLWDDVIVFLHKFRPILLNNERTNFYKVYNVIAKELQHHYFRRSLQECHELYSGKRSQRIARFESNGETINSEKILFDWLNSYEFHREQSKREFIDSLHQMIPLDASKVMFLRMLQDKAKATFWLANFASVILTPQHGMSYPVARI